MVSKFSVVASMPPPFFQTCGIRKRFNNRYKLQRFSTSFVRMALKYNTDIIPFATVNGEYINPYTYSYRWINRIFQKIGIPFLPIGIITIMVFLQPWFFYTAWPASLVFVMGKRIRPSDYTDKPFSDLTRDDFGHITGQIKAEMQKQLLEAEKEWGKQPFKWNEFWRLFFKHFNEFPFNMPFGWPLLFAEFERRYYRLKERPVKLNLNFFSVFRILVQNPITICYYIPILGWIPLLIKGYRNNTLGKQED
jgi:hypothetical protein